MEFDDYENHPQRELKLRLKYNRLKREVDGMVEWNFGYSPSNDPYFDDKLSNLLFLAKILKIDI